MRSPNGPGRRGGARRSALVREAQASPWAKRSFLGPKGRGGVGGLGGKGRDGCPGLGAAWTLPPPQAPVGGALLHSLTYSLGPLGPAIPSLAFHPFHLPPTSLSNDCPLSPGTWGHRGEASKAKLLSIPGRIQPGYSDSSPAKKKSSLWIQPIGGSLRCWSAKRGWDSVSHKGPFTVTFEAS